MGHVVSWKYYVSWWPIFKSSHCKLFEESPPRDFNPWVPKLPLSFGDWSCRECTRIMVPGMTTRVTCNIWSNCATSFGHLFLMMPKVQKPIISRPFSSITPSVRDDYCWSFLEIPDSGPLLTHWGQVTHICVGNLTIIGSDNGLLPGRRQAIIWTNAEMLLIGPLGTNFSEILIAMHTFLFKKIHLKLSSVKWQPFCLGLNVLTKQTPSYGCRNPHCKLKKVWGLSQCKDAVLPV